VLYLCGQLVTGREERWGVIRAIQRGVGRCGLWRTKSDIWVILVLHRGKCAILGFQTGNECNPGITE